MRPAFEVVGQGSPLVLVPGTFSDRRVWQRVVGSLQRDHRCLLLDPRGTGETPDPGTPFTPDDLADDTLAAMDAAGFERSDLVGHSLGAAVALTIAARFPARVRRVVAIGPSLTTDAHLAMLLDHWEALAGSDLDERALARGLVIDAFGRDAFERLVPAVVADWVRRPIARETVLRYVDCDRGQDLRPLLSRIDARALVVAGAEDGLPGPAQAAAVAEAMPDAELSLIEGSGHTPQVERPVAVVRLLSSFLGS
ncbi:MAG: alpha/beta hydrolase [Candidatus Dormiibacterota bacterium]